MDAIAAVAHPSVSISGRGEREMAESSSHLLADSAIGIVGSEWCCDMVRDFGGEDGRVLSDQPPIGLNCFVVAVLRLI